MTKKLVYMLENSGLFDEITCLEENDFCDDFIELKFLSNLEDEYQSLEDSYVDFSDVKY